MSTPSLGGPGPGDARSPDGGPDAGQAAAREPADRSIGADTGAGPSQPAIDAASSIEALSAETTAFVGAFDRWSARRAADAGASIPRIKLLYAIHCHGPRKMADLAGELDVTPRNVTALVDGLEAEGLVRRVPHATDRRVTLVELTCNRDRVADQFATYQGSIGSLFADLDDAQRAALVRLLSALRTKMRADDAAARRSDA
jgi:DNA-binding MarR family transcriptional regulator